MKNLLIIGARGWGREVCWYFKNEPTDKDIRIKGFLDSDKHALDGYKGDYPPIISDVESYVIQPDDVFFCALGDPKYRKFYSEIIEKKGGRFVTYISPRAFVYPNTTIGEGSFICWNTVITDNVVIGRHVMIHGLTSIGHDVKVGNYTSIESYCFLGGFAEVGDMCIIHVRSSIIRHKKIGNSVTVGAHSLVIRNVKDGESVFGSPATRI